MTITDLCLLLIYYYYYYYIEMLRHRKRKHQRRVLCASRHGKHNKQSRQMGL